MLASKHLHVTGNGTTPLREAGEVATLRRVVVGSPGTAGTVTIETAGGADIAIITLGSGSQATYDFDLDLRTEGLQVVAAGLTGSPSVTVLYD